MESYLYDDRLSVYRWPQPNAQATVLLIHGLGEHAGRYEEVVEQLGQAKLSVIAVDLPGHGNSLGKRGHIPSLQSLYQDLEQILKRECTENGPLLVYGHSLGGFLALDFCIDRQDRIDGVIATSPYLATPRPIPAWKVVLAKSLGRFLPSLTVDNGLRPSDISSDDQEVDKYLHDPLHHRKISAALGLELMSGGQRLLDRATDWKLPLLLMHGSDDRITSCAASRKFAEAASASASASKVTFVEWPSGRHELHHDVMRDDVFRSIADWIRTPTTATHDEGEPSPDSIEQA